ncbi:MAG: T9SS type A sorting domain-containing protein [Fibrobacteres bacterium]|nr:T9SS type A sorting domain-containing protein [Fibrobacterota bacterium]
MVKKSALSLLGAVVFSFSALNVPLDVNNWADIARNGEPVTQGICLPRGMITDVTNLKITNESGTVVPAQFRVLSKWWVEKNNGSTTNPSAKWVLCDFKPSSIGAKSSARFFLKDGGGNSTPTTSVTLVQDASFLTVSNGLVKFTVSKTKFNLFDELWFDANGNSTFDATEKIIESSTANGGFITAGDWADQGCVPGTVHSTATAAPVRIVVEENGPMKVVLRVEGRHYAATGGVTKGLYDYQVFITAFAGTPFVDVQWAVTNLYMEGTKPAQTGTSDPYKVYVWPFTNYSLVMNLKLGASQNYTVLGATEVTGSATSTPVKLLQQTGAFSLTGTAGGTDALGAAGLSDGSISVMAALRDFTPNVPKGISVKQGQISLELFPDTGTGVKYWLDPYTRKNHRFRLQFGTGALASGALTALSKSVNTPLRMLAPREWYQSCRAWYRGLGIPNATKWQRKAPTAWTRQVTTSSTPVKHIPDNNYSPVNWFTYGQIAEFNGAGDHWNFTSRFFEYLMTGDPKTFEDPESKTFYFNDIVPVQFSWYDDPFVKLDWFLGAENHLNGLTSYHGPTNNITWNGTYVNFPGWTYYRSNTPDNGHMPQLQQIEYYQLTGDHATKDAILAMGARAIASVMGYCYFTANPEWPPRRPLVLDSIFAMPMQQRYISRPGIVAAHAYEVSGDDRFRRTMDIAAYSMRNFVKQHPTGYMAKPDDRSYLPNTDAGVLNIWKVKHPTDTAFPRSFAANDFMIGIAQEMLYSYYLLTENREIRDALIFSAKSLEQRAGMSGSTYTGFIYGGYGDYLQMGARYHLCSSTGTPEFTSSMAEGLGGMIFGYLLSGRSDVWNVIAEGAKVHKPDGFDSKVINLFEAIYTRDSLDRTPPAKVQDLTSENVQGVGVKLSWTAPGNNGTTGRAKEYQIKYAKVPIVDIVSPWDSVTRKGWPDFNGPLPYSRTALLDKAKRYRDSVEIAFWAVQNIANNPVPAAAGTVENFIVTGLDSLCRYYFALVAFDSAHNVSEISNVSTLITGVGAEKMKGDGLSFSLKNAAPNPFNPITRISFSLPSASSNASYQLSVYNANGKLVRTLMKGSSTGGVFATIWDGKDGDGKELSSGVYIVKLRSAKYSGKLKVVLSR